MSGNKTVYLKFPQVKEVTRPEVFLGDVAEVYCKDKATEAKVRAIKLYTFPAGKKKAVYVGALMELAARIEALDGGISLQNLGETDFVVTYQPHIRTAPLFQWMKTAAVAVIAFCGAAFAIMTFHNDSNVTDVFGNFYLLVMGTEAQGPTILDLSYSIGLALGILLFFNHFASWKLTVDPTPIEVEMRLYEENVNKTRIQNGERKESGVDVS